MKSGNDDKNIKILKIEIKKLKLETKIGLKQIIIKIQEEKMDLPKKLMEMESQYIFNKVNDDQSD